MGTRSTRHRRISQRLPTNRRAPQREERLVDVCPLVIPHAQTAKLIEPGKRPLHDPPPAAQSTPVCDATHGEPRHDMPRPRLQAFCLRLGFRYLNFPDREKALSDVCFQNCFQRERCCSVFGQEKTWVLAAAELT